MKIGKLIVFPYFRTLTAFHYLNLNSTRDIEKAEDEGCIVKCDFWLKCILRIVSEVRI